MDGFNESSLDNTISDIPIPIPRGPGASRYSGWLVGAAIGVLVSLWAFPSVRYTLLAQIESAAAEDTVPWLSSLDIQRSARELPRLDLVASRHPDDYLIQVGRATAHASSGSLHLPGQPKGIMGVGYDQTLARLAVVTRAFSATPGAYAHLARYLMAERVRIPRSDRKSPDSVRVVRRDPNDIPAPSERSVRIMEWALKSGERIDSDNAFWAAMLATTYFAAGRDSDALDALARAARGARWDAYIYEEVLGQWRLYSAAYGDHGATQKIGPLSLIVFPHLHEIRRMAEMVRWHAERSAAEGKLRQAAQMRRNLAHLGTNLRDNARWAYEALYGTDLFFIACTDSNSKLSPSRIRTPADWREQAIDYQRLLRQIHRDYELRLLQNDVESCCDLRKRVDLARYDASYPGIPPGIPLMPLFGNWIAGICLIQQILGLLVALSITGIWTLISGRPGGWRRVWRTTAFVLVPVGTVIAGVVFFSTITTVRMAGFLLIGFDLIAIAMLQWIWAIAEEWRKKRSLQHREIEDEWARHEEHDTGKEAALWTIGTTIRMLIVVVLPYLVILYTHRGELSALHPVAILLTGLGGVPAGAGAGAAMETALYACALPLLIPLASALRGMYRGLGPAGTAVLGLRKLALPTLVCLVATYAVMLNRMLVLDAEASQAIQKAAQNDRQWVLTHGADNPF